MERKKKKPKQNNGKFSLLSRNQEFKIQMHGLFLLAIPLFPYISINDQEEIGVEDKISPNTLKNHASFKNRYILKALSTF